MKFAGDLKSSATEEPTSVLASSKEAQDDGELKHARLLGVAKPRLGELLAVAAAAKTLNFCTSVNSPIYVVLLANSKSLMASLRPLSTEVYFLMISQNHL